VGGVFAEDAVDPVVEVRRERPLDTAGDVPVVEGSSSFA
jgi:hypothetical protein